MPVFFSPSLFILLPFSFFSSIVHISLFLCLFASIAFSRHSPQGIFPLDSLVSFLLPPFFLLVQLNVIVHFVSSFLLTSSSIHHSSLPGFFSFLLLPLFITLHLLVSFPRSFFFSPRPLLTHISSHFLLSHLVSSFRPHFSRSCPWKSFDVCV